MADRYTHDPTRNAGARTTHDPTVAQGGAFPVQYPGFRTYWGGAVRELCLVAAADAPAGMGAVPKIDKNGTLYVLYLVETNDANASSVRVQTTTVTKAIRLKT